MKLALTIVTCALCTVGAFLLGLISGTVLTDMPNARKRFDDIVEDNVRNLFAAEHRNEV